jgi:hypothetical protein
MSQSGTEGSKLVSDELTIRLDTLQKLRRSLEAAGVEFVPRTAAVLKRGLGGEGQ